VGERGVFVDWRAVNSMFCGAMWFLALVLALVILVSGLPAPAAPPIHQAPLHAVAR
jgi:hypothetical protein